MKKQPNKYELYEHSVQTPDAHVETMSLMYAEIIGRSAKHFREDFCGTFAMSCEWVKLRPKNTALAIDLDAEPLNYGKSVHLSKMRTKLQKRIKVLQKNVLEVRSPKSDIICACNFSFFVFKSRKLLLQYFKNSLKALSKEGVLILEMAGGPGMIKTMKEKSTYKHRKYGTYQYVWDQKSFDPITHHAQYAIHYNLKDGRKLKNVFTYDWRLWTIPEVRDVLMEAGFKEVHTYWEISKNGKSTGEYVRQKQGDNAYAWIAYVVGQK